MMEAETKTALVVDDNRDYAENLAEILQEQGFRTITCLSAGQALEAVKREKVHIAIVDVLLPDLGGLHLLEKLLDHDPKMGVIMVTGQVSLETAVRALNQGAFGYALKYCDPEEILAHVRRAVQHQEAVERAEFSRSLYRTIFERSSDGICVLEGADSCRISDLNEPFARILGLEREAIVGRTLSDLGPQGDPRSLAAVVKPLLGVNPSHLEDVKVTLPDGRSRDMTLRLGPLKPGEPGPIQLLVRDITEDKRMRERIAHAEKLALLGEFTSRVAHEVRNPLAGIKGALEIIQGKLEKDPESRRVIQAIFNRIDQLDVFIRDLLQFARPARPEPRMVPAAEILPKVMGLTQADPLFRNIEIELDLEKDADIYVDPGTLQIVLTNLLRNAAEAMEGEGTIRISVKKAHSEALLVVEDDGPGFSGDPETFFTPFTTTRSAGTGLGLAIARNLVEAHGGSLTGSNRPGGRGARLEIFLPGPPGGEE